jgi:hypothetical protein
MPRHWVHSGDPFGKKKSQLIFIPNGPHHAFIRSVPPQCLNSALLLNLETAEGAELTELIR